MIVIMLLLILLMILYTNNRLWPFANRSFPPGQLVTSEYHVLVRGVEDMRKLSSHSRPLRVARVHAIKNSRVNNFTVLHMRQDAAEWIRLLLLS